jgi:hypothetical protein
MLHIIRSGSRLLPAACRPLTCITSRAFTGEASYQYDLTAMQQDIQSIAQDFAKEELQPHGSRWDQVEEFPVATLRKAAGLGFAGLYVAEDVGGTALSRLDGAVVFESLAYGDIPVTAYLTIHNMVACVIDRHVPHLCQRFGCHKRGNGVQLQRVSANACHRCRVCCDGWFDLRLTNG